MLAAGFVILALALSGQGAQAPAQQPQTQPQAPALAEWGDTFDGDALDATKWKQFSFEGGGGRVKVEDGKLKMRGTSGSRAGVRTEQDFSGDRFIVEATVAAVASALPEPGQAPPIGNAILTVLFDGSGRNRIEWIFTSEGTFEAWSMVDGRGERLDSGRRLATKEKAPTIGIARRGDEFFFSLNGEVGLQKTIKNVPRDFRVMLYGFGSSQNDWDSVRVVVPK